MTARKTGTETHHKYLNQNQIQSQKPVFSICFCVFMLFQCVF